MPDLQVTDHVITLLRVGHRHVVFLYMFLVICLSLFLFLVIQRIPRVASHIITDSRRYNWSRDIKNRNFSHKFKFWVRIFVVKWSAYMFIVLYYQSCSRFNTLVNLNSILRQNSLMNILLVNSRWCKIVLFT